MKKKLILSGLILCLLPVSSFSQTSIHHLPKRIPTNSPYALLYTEDRTPDPVPDYRFTGVYMDIAEKKIVYYKQRIPARTLTNYTGMPVFSGNFKIPLLN